MVPRLLAGAILTLAAVAIALVGIRTGNEANAPEGLAPGVTAPPARFAGSRIPAGVRAPDLGLRDERGRIVRMRDLRGRPVIVTFLYSTCEDTCPLVAQQVRGALDALGHDVPALAVSVDPARDTPVRARRFLAQQRVSGRLRFVLGPRRALQPVWDGYAIRPQSVREEHQARIVLVDGGGFQRVGFPASEATPERIAHDLRALE